MRNPRALGTFFKSLTHPNPGRDWSFTLTLVIAVFLLFASYAGYIFFGIQSGLIASRNAIAFPAQTVTGEEIQSVLESYRARKANYDAHIEPVLPVTDPAAAPRK